MPDTNKQLLKSHSNKLEKLLLNLKQELDSMGLSTPLSNLTDLDEYILSLNSYYYESFYQRVFPLFKAEIEAEISALYKLSIQQNKIKTEIISNIKRYALLYNQLKTIKTILEEKREQIQLEMLSFSREEDQGTIELLFIIKELRNTLYSFQDKLHIIQEMMDDEKFFTSLNKYPAHLSINRVLFSLKLDNPADTRTLNRFILSLQMILKYTVELQLSNDPCKDAGKSIINEINKHILALQDKKIPFILRNWYKEQMDRQMQLYLEIISLYALRNDRRGLLKTTQQMEDWLNSLLYLIEQSIFYISREIDKYLLIDSFYYNMHHTEIRKLAEALSVILKNIDEIINNFSTANGSFDTYCIRCMQILEEADSFMQINGSEQLHDLPILSKELGRISQQFAMTKMQISLLNEKISDLQGLNRHYTSIIVMIDSYLDLLSKIKDQLSKTLAPRNIKRDYKDFSLRLERIELKPGKVFPAEYSYLLEKPFIEFSTSEQAEFTVLHEEGDIFIIYLDDMIEELIPKIIISRSE